MVVLSFQEYDATRLFPDTVFKAMYWLRSASGMAHSMYCTEYSMYSIVSKYRGCWKYCNILRTVRTVRGRSIAKRDQLSEYSVMAKATSTTNPMFKQKQPYT